jgi:hypothetical protein
MAMMMRLMMGMGMDEYVRAQQRLPIHRVLTLTSLRESVCPKAFLTCRLFTGTMNPIAMSCAKPGIVMMIAMV